MPKINRGDDRIDALNEEDLARYFEERRGDISQWEPTPKKIRRRRGGPSTIFSLRLAPEELQELHTVALTRGMNLSDFIRSAALRESREKNSKAKVINEALANLRTTRASLEQIELDLERAN
jgi:hypothetical protein